MRCRDELVDQHHKRALIEEKADASSKPAVRPFCMSSQQTGQTSSRHAALRTSHMNANALDRRPYLHAVPDLDQRTPAIRSGVECEGHCHYCQGPETD